jgi:hypothetical protein
MGLILVNTTSAPRSSIAPITTTIASPVQLPTRWCSALHTDHLHLGTLFDMRSYSYRLSCLVSLICQPG